MGPKYSFERMLAAKWSFKTDSRNFSANLILILEATQSAKERTLLDLVEIF